MNQIKDTDTFFQDGTQDRSTSEMTYVYHFDTIREMRELLSERLQTEMTEEEIFDAVKTAFRNKPSADTAAGPSEGIVDYIYQM